MDCSIFLKNDTVLLGAPLGTEDVVLPRRLEAELALVDDSRCKTEVMLNLRGITDVKLAAASFGALVSSQLFVCSICSSYFNSFNTAFSLNTCKLTWS